MSAALLGTFFAKLLGTTNPEVEATLGGGGGVGGCLKRVGD